MTKKFAKVFGERNTGTHFLEAVLRLNTSLEVIEHGANQRPIERTAAILQNHHIDAASEQARYVFERMIDAERNSEFASTFGWKHAAVSLSRLRLSPLFEVTQFIFLVRNPWRYLAGLYRNPYHLMPRPSCGFLEFLSTPFIATERDGLVDCFVSSPVEFWNKKVQSYLRVGDELDDSVLVRYEDLVLRPDLVIARLAGCCQVAPMISIPERTSPNWKHGQRSYAEYRREVVAYDPFRELGASAFEAIRSRLDPELLERTGYAAMLG